MGIEVKRDAKGVWYAQPYLGTTPEGKQIRPRRSFPEAATRAQAQELANRWLSDISAGGKVQSVVIADLLYAYIDERRAKGVSPYTVKRWKLFTRSYVGRYLKGKSVLDLGVMEFNDFETRLLLPKDKDPKDCRDEAGLVAYLIPRTGVLGVTLMLYGTFNLINEQMDEALLGYPWMFIPIGVLLVVIFWYAFALSSGYRKYFE